MQASHPNVRTNCMRRFYSEKIGAEELLAPQIPRLVPSNMLTDIQI